MKQFYSLCLFLVVYTWASAQVVTIRDEETGLPINRASLSSDAPSAFTFTNVRGQADLRAFAGSEQIEIHAIGYSTVTRNYAELEREGFAVSLAPYGLSLDDVVVSAVRWNQPQRETPNKVGVIQRRDVSLQNPQTAADLLGISGEAFIQKSQLGGGSPMIRGFATNRLLIAVDGVRMNTAIFRSGNLQNVISLDAFATESAELFFGPGSVMYGSDAIGGVMSFQTLGPQLALGEDAEVSGSAVTRFSSANNERTGHFDVNVGWKKWAMLTSFTHSDFDDLRMGRYGPDEYLRPYYVQHQDSVDVVVTNPDPLVQKPTGYGQTNLMQKVRFSPNENWDFLYAFHYSTTTDVPRYDRLIRPRNGTLRSAEWYYGPQDWMMNQLTVSHNGGTPVYDQMAIRLAHQHFEESRVERNLNSPERLIRIEKVNALSANVDFNKSIGSKHKLFYGLEAVMNNVESIGIDEDISTATRVDGPARYPQSDWASYAAYLTYQFRVSDKFLVQAGARYNQFMLDAVFDTTFYPFPFTKANINAGAPTGSLGVVYNPSEKWTIAVNASTGFRSPNVDDVGKVFDSEPGSVVIPNPDLSAEYAYNAEVDVAKVFGDFLKIDVAGFYTVLENALVRRDFTLNGEDSILYDGQMSQVQAIQNAAVATVYGAQVGVEIKLPAGFGISGRFNFQKGEEELDNGDVSPSRHAAPPFGVARLTYGAKRLRLDFYAMFSGEVSYENLSEEGRGTDYIYAVDPDGNPYSPSWYTLNFKALYQITDNFAISGGVENLADVRYRPYSSGIVAAGRNVILSLRANF